MAQSAFVVDAGDGNTPVHHALTIFRDSIKNTLFDRMGLMGKPNSGKPIVVDTTLQGKAGEDVRFHFVPYADVDPILGQGVSIEGNENSFNEFNDLVRVDSVNYPFRKEGDMTSQRTILQLRSEMRMQIANHFSQHNDREITKRLSGIALTEGAAVYQAAADTTDRVNGANRCIAASGSNGFNVITEANSDNTALNASMTSADTMSPRLIKRSQVLARTQDTNNPYRMQSIRSSNGKEWYTFFISPEQAYDLTFHPDWFVRMVATIDAGLDKDPFAVGSLGTIGNVVIHEHEFITTFIDAASATQKFARGLMFGQNALLLGFAQTLVYVEKKFNYDKEMGVNGSQIRGEKKISFTNKDSTATDVDFGVMQVISASN